MNEHLRRAIDHLETSTGRDYFAVPAGEFHRQAAAVEAAIAQAETLVRIADALERIAYPLVTVTAPEGETTP